MSLLNQGLFFIDQRGKSVIAQQRRTDEGVPLADEGEILKEAVEQAGWAAVFAEPKRSAVNVQFDVESVSEATLNALSAVLLRYDFKEILLSFKVLDWQRERHSDSALAAARVWMAVREGENTLTKQKVDESFQSPDSLLAGHPQGEAATAAIMFDAWKRQGGSYFASLPSMMESLDAGHHSHILEMTRDQPCGVFRHVGANCALMGRFEEGFPLIAYPDPLIGRWASARYRQIVASGEPQLSQITVRPRASQGHSYRCLRLPWKNAGGNPHFTIIRINDPA